MADVCVKVDGCGPPARTLERLASDITGLGLPAEPRGVFRYMEPEADSWLSLLADALTWRRVLSALGVAAGKAPPTERLEPIRRRLCAAGRGMEEPTVYLAVPFPGDRFWGAYASLPLADEGFLGRIRMWCDRVPALETALFEIEAEGRAPGANIYASLAPWGFRLRWYDRPTKTRHACDCNRDGSRRGPIVDG